MDSIESMNIACEGVLSKINAWNTKRAERRNAKHPDMVAQVNADVAARREAKFNELSQKYSIRVDEVPAGTIRDKNELVRQIFADLRKWTAIIKRSDVTKKIVMDALAEYDKDPENSTLWMAGYDDGRRPTAAAVMSGVKVDDGVNGNEESASIIDDEQSICVLLGHIPEALAYFLAHRYAAYLKNVGSGDGDEGHVYYEIRTDAFNTSASEAYTGHYDFDKYRKSVSESADLYGIDIGQPIPKASIMDNDELIESIHKDAKAWLGSVVRSAYLKEMIIDQIHKYDSKDGYLFDAYDRKPSARELARRLAISDDSAGKYNGIQVVNTADLRGSRGQNINIMFSPIVKDIENMIAYKYSNYLSSVSMGDADNGTVSFSIK